MQIDFEMRESSSQSREAALKQKLESTEGSWASEKQALKEAKQKLAKTSAALVRTNLNGKIPYKTCEIP